MVFLPESDPQGALMQSRYILITIALLPILLLGCQDQLTEQDVMRIREQGLAGPVGPAGPEGRQGPAGQPGPEGPRGQAGLVGLRGQAGPAGPVGPQGQQGESSIGSPVGESVPTPTSALRPTLAPTGTPPPPRVPTRAPARAPTPTSRPVITGVTSAVNLTRWAQDAVVRVTAGHSSAGTGFIFDTTGETAFVVTAHHVVEDDTGDIDVRVNGRTYTGTLLGYNSEDNADVAVISICCNVDFHSLPWERGGNSATGMSVLALGRPRGETVSTTGKVVPNSVGSILSLVSHDAPIQPGSSGGPLLAMDGSVLGVNVATSKIEDRVYYAVPYSAISAQVLEWKSRLVVLESTPAPQQSASDLSFSGVGHRELFWSVPVGRYIVTATISGNDGEYSDTFQAEFEHVVDGESWRFWESDAKDGSFTYLVNVGDGSERSYERDLLGGNQLVKVQVADDDSRGSWTITFEPAQ